ncbi:MAG: lactate utilization protein, partial [Clostridia bacterium]|nr:lactate utilization protein [Clostridia bacterium]
MPKNWHKEVMGRKAAEALTKNNFKAIYVETKEEAAQKALELMEDSKSIGLGTSMTLKELGIAEEIRKTGKEVFDHTDPSLSPEEKLEMRRQQQVCDCFLSSTNAVTLDGKLVNVDGTGNRVSAMIFGPKKVIVIAGF